MASYMYMLDFFYLQAVRIVNRQVKATIKQETPWL